MQINEFIEATSRLESYFTKEYTAEQRQIMYEELKEISIERYRKLISVLMRKNKFLPKLADFIEVNDDTPYANNQEENTVDCKKCNNTGYLIYKKSIKDGNRTLINTYAAVCQCGNRKQYKGWEIADTIHRSNYYIPLAAELGM